MLSQRTKKPSRVLNTRRLLIHNACSALRFVFLFFFLFYVVDVFLVSNKGIIDVKLELGTIVAVMACIADLLDVVA